MHNIQHRYYLAPPQSLSRKQINTILPLCKPLFIVNVRVKSLLKLHWSTKTKHVTSKSGRGTCITRLYERYVSSFSADK